MKILVADDHPLYREAVRVQIERLFDQVSVFEVPSLEEASELASGQEAPFDLFLIEFVKNLNGFFDVATRVIHQRPRGGEE